MAKRWILACLVLVALAGCLHDPPAGEVSGTPSGLTRGADQYWFVWVTGMETRDPMPGSVCDVAWSHSIDEAARAIEYSDAEYTQNAVVSQPKIIIASTVWDASSCPLSYKVISANVLEFETKALGKITVRVFDDGLVQVGDTELRPGQSWHGVATASVSDADGQAEYTDDVLVRAMGPWPRSGLQAVA